ncbi:MAG: ribosomal protein S18-alanine N-acetyltransferase [Candidatus Margulisbacteria bacterium]|nr:ribosomal protein S18-alanine N-acetyltransferase [Candidatus Margulisiibacteriota bacterium]
MIKLQKAQANDLAFLERIHQQTIASVWSREDFLNALDKDDKIVSLIIEQGSPVGYIMVDVLPPEAELINIAIGPENQSRGIGSKAMKILMNNLREKKIESIFLEVRATSKAVDFYKSNGFEVIGVRKKYYPDGENALRMRLCITYSKIA